MLIFFLFSCSSLTFENRRKKNARHIEPWSLFSSHIFIQNDKAMSVDWCSVFLFFFILACFLCVYSSQASFYWWSMPARFSAHIRLERRRRKKGTVRKNMGTAVVSNFLCQFSSCARKRRRERTTTALIDGWKDARTEETYTLFTTYTQSRNAGKEKREKRKMPAKTINNNNRS
jgi:hypothetical protein